MKLTLENLLASLREFNPVRVKFSDGSHVTELIFLYSLNKVILLSGSGNTFPMATLTCSLERMSGEYHYESGDFFVASMASVWVGHSYKDHQIVGIEYIDGEAILLTSEEIEAKVFGHPTRTLREAQEES